MRVLVVEDEIYLAEAIQIGLRREAIATDIIHDGLEALERLAVNEYDAVVLDRDIPGMHGDDVCKVIASDYPDVRVLMLTAARRLNDKVDGLSLGADDYLSKPFEFAELVARLRALNRRSSQARPPVYECGDLRLDPFRREVYRNGRFIRLGRKEFAVLELLLIHRGGFVTTETLLEKAWDENADPFTNVVRVTMSTLRKRLGDPNPIETVPGIGYRLGGEYAKD